MLANMPFLFPDESNILQIYCKLYLWDSSNSVWKERGKGLLRLNDKINNDQVSSRLGKHILSTRNELDINYSSNLLYFLSYANIGMS